MKRSSAPLIMAITIAVLAVVWAYYSFFSPYTPQTTFFPQTDLARSTHRVYTFVNLLLLAIFVAVEGFLVWTMFRYRKEDAKPGDDLPEQVHGNTTVEVGLTLATTALVLILFVPSCQEIQFQQRDVPEDAMVIQVTGKQWWWEFYYPEQDIVVANEMHVPSGRPVRLDVTSTDVIHSFWVPLLGGKRDTVPGREQMLWFTPEEPGVYDGQCAEYCGTSHALMSMQTVVDTPEDFDKWVAQQKAPTDPAAMGMFGTFAAAGCIACHQTMANNGTVRNQLGPNLRKLATRGQLAAGILPNDDDHLRKWIANPQYYKPNAKMHVPAPQCLAEGDPDPCCLDAGIGNCLEPQVLDQLVTYLSYMK